MYSSRLELLLLPLNKLFIVNGMMVIRYENPHLVNHSVKLEISVHIVCCFKITMLHFSVRIKPLSGHHKKLVFQTDALSVFRHAQCMMGGSMHGQPFAGFIPTAEVCFLMSEKSQRGILQANKCIVMSGFMSLSPLHFFIKYKYL